MSGMDSQVRRDVKTVDCCVQVISSFARHYKTGEPLADSVVHDMCAAKHLFAASVSLLFVCPVFFRCMCAAKHLCCICKSVLSVCPVYFLCVCAAKHLFAAAINLLSLYVESNINSQPKQVYCQLVITDAHYAVAAFAFQDLQQQTFYSVLDQLYHGPHPLPGPSTTSVLIGVQERYSSVPYVRDTVQSLSLIHI